MRILVASNDLTFNPSLVLAYRARGHEVAAGVSNFVLRLGDYDIVHLHWPEELVGFGTNCTHAGRTAHALDLLDWWAKRAVIVTTVHNLMPHDADSTGGPETAYFQAFYERADLICHFSEHSHGRYSQVYPKLDPTLHIVHGLNNFAHLQPLAEGCALARQRLGLLMDVAVFSVIGAVRKPEELYLLRRAWSLASLRAANLIFAVDPPWHRMRLLTRVADKIKHRHWLSKNQNILNIGGNIDDTTLVRVVEASNAIIVLRFGHHLNSGLLPLALTFGTPVIAPDYGVNSEVLANTMNALYFPGDARSLAAAISHMSTADSILAREENLKLARRLGWSAILDKIWGRIMAVGARKGLPAFAG
jgi:glycosyltransferase involved in cell wall biosynthesis